MQGVLRHRIHQRGELIHNTVESAFLTAGSLLITLLTILVLFFGVFLSRAT